MPQDQDRVPGPYPEERCCKKSRMGLSRAHLLYVRSCFCKWCDWFFSQGPSKGPAMNGTLGFKEVSFFPSRSTSHRFQYEQRHRFGTGTWQLLLAIQIFSFLLLCVPCLPSSSQAQPPPPPAPITSSGLNTQIHLSPTPPAGMVQYDITGGTRPGGGENLFHSFGEFSVPNHNITNFLNETPALHTSNILGRITGGNSSNIFGTIKTTDFGNANLFLMNPAGFLFGPNATINVGGMVSVTSADYLKLEGNARFNAIPNATADAMLTAAPVEAFGFLGSNAASIAIQGGTLEVPEGRTLSFIGGPRTFTTDLGAIVPSGVSMSGGSLSAPNGLIYMATVASPGEVPVPTLSGAQLGSLGSPSSGPAVIRIRSGEFVMDHAFLTATNTSDAAQSAIQVNVQGAMTLRNASSISTDALGGGHGSDMHIAAQSTLIDGVGSSISTDTQGTGAGGNISLFANSVTLQNGGTLSAKTSGTKASATGGTITLDAGQVLLNNTANIRAGTSGPGNAGHINITGAESITLQDSIIDNGVNTPPAKGNAGTIQLTSPTIALHNSRIRTSTSGLGNAGDVNVAVGEITLTDSQIQARTTSGGNAGDISIHGRGGTESNAQSITLKGSLILSDTVGENFYLEGNAGNISIRTGRLALTESSGITTAASASSGSARNITINATDSVTISQSSLTSNSEDSSLGNAGNITIISPSISVENGGIVATSTDFIGKAGAITFTTASLQLTNGGTLSAKTSGTKASATGGTITVDATNTVTMTNGAAITANSTGAADAGDINITATNGLSMQNSSITTLVTQSATGSTAGGGNIKVTTSPTATVNIQNSTISASVPGSGDGGNISIDPEFVILQNGRILAQTDQGTGGNITITASVFLPDATSVVNADSGSGVNGTVTIQSPNAPASGKVQPLGNQPLQATSLLNQRCAALAGGEFSSFTMAGRDSLPTEPGSWLSSPLALAISESDGSTMTDTGLRASRNEPTGEPPLLSLRQIAPPGFLTQTFAVDGSAGCQS